MDLEVAKAQTLALVCVQLQMTAIWWTGIFYRKKQSRQIVNCGSLLISNSKHLGVDRALPRVILKDSEGGRLAVLNAKLHAHILGTLFVAINEPGP